MNFFSRIKAAKAAFSGSVDRSGIFATLLSFLYPFTPFDPKKYYTSWVFAAINAIAEQVSTMELKLQHRKANGDWEDIKEHKALSLLKKVNPEMTSSELFYSVPAWCESEGNAFWIVVYNALGEPVELWPYDSTRVTIHVDEEGMVDGYLLLTDKGVYRPVESTEVIPFKRYNIKDRHRGIGSIEAVKLEADTDMHAASWSRNFYFNSAIPSATLETEKNLTTEQVNEIKTQWYSQYGGTANAGKTGLLHSGIKFKPNTVAQRDMQYLEQRKYSRDSIIAIFRVPPVILGIIENANRANIEGAEYIFAKYRVKPYMEFIIDHLNEFYLPLWKLSQDDYRFALAVDPVPANEELVLKKKTSSYGKWVTANEIREEEGREPVDGGDVLGDPSSMSLSMPPEETPTKSKKKTLLKTNDPIVKGKNALLKKHLSSSAKVYQSFLDKTKESLLDKLKDQKSLQDSLSTKGYDATTLFLMKLRSATKDSDEEFVRLLFEDWDDWIGILYNSLKDDDEIAMAYGGKIALQRVDVAMKFNLENERVQRWIEDTALRNATSIVGTLKDDLRAVILDAVTAGEGAKGVADALQESYSQLDDWKALQIARSELCSAYSQGSLEGYRQSEVVERKEWFTGGANPCVTCQGNADQGSIPLDEQFESGHDCPTCHPNDECTLLPVINKD